MGNKKEKRILQKHHWDNRKEGFENYNKKTVLKYFGEPDVINSKTVIYEYYRYKNHFTAFPKTEYFLQNKKIKLRYHYIIFEFNDQETIIGASFGEDKPNKRYSIIQELPTNTKL